MKIVKKIVTFHDASYIVHPDTNLSMFRKLTQEEHEQFVVWAREHYLEEIKPIYHPVVQDTMFHLNPKHWETV